jgi:trimethylamine---corrinoid protein Co-methyltransferase
LRLQPGTVDVLSEAEVRRIHAAALRVLDETGMWIENDDLLRHLEGAGGRVDYASQRVRFDPALVERFIADSDKVDWSTIVPSASASSGVFFGLYHDPESDALLPWNEERLARYFALAQALPNVGRCSMLGCPTGVSARLEPLYEKLICWKYGAHDSGTIHLDELCPYLYDLFQLRAQQVGKPVKDVFRGVAYLVPPLKLGRHEAYQFMYFYERGLEVHLGDMYAMGATSPVTLAGSVALNLAEHFALGIMRRAFFGGTGFWLGSSLSPLDMRTMLYPYGRPELAYTNVMTAQMARFYRLPYGGHAGLSEAKLPSCEAGAQKALTAITTLLAAGHVHMDAGLLSTDEVCSPIQMILDDEFCGSLKHLCKQFGTEDEDLAVEVIAAVGPGGNYMATDHTAAHFRSEHWEPRVWSRRTLSGWLERKEGLDVDRAREVYRAMLPDLDTTPRLTETEQRDIQALIGRAAADLGW